MAEICTLSVEVLEGGVPVLLVGGYRDAPPCEVAVVDGRLRVLRPVKGLRGVLSDRARDDGWPALAGMLRAVV